MKSLKFTFNDFDDVNNPLLAAGQAYATLEVGKRLVRRGHSVTILSSRYPGYKDRTENGMKYVHIGLGSGNVKLNNFIYPFVLPFSVVRQDTDIIIDFFTAPFSALCSQLFTRKPVIGVPTCFEAEEFREKYHLPFDIIEKLGCKTYKYFLPYTEHYARKMKRYAPNVRQQIIPEGVDDHFLALQKKTSKNVLFLGRFDMHQKGIDLLLKAWAKIADKVEIPLVLAGFGTDDTQIHDLVTELKIESSVKFAGAAYGKRKDKLLQESLFVAFPSRHEGFSLFSLEALASANALVGFDIPGLSWTTTGVKKIKNFSVDEYAQTMLQLIRKPEQTIKLGEAARQSARNYTWDKVVDQWLAFIEKNVKKEKHD